MKKILKDKKERLYIIFAILATIAAIIFVGFNYYKRANNNLLKTPQLSTQIPAPQRKEEANLSLSHPFKANLGEKIPLDIVVKTDHLLSGIAVRLTYSFNDNLPLQPIEGKFRINPDLINANWTFPVNKISVDRENKTVMADLAVVYVNPEGFPFSKPLILASLDLQVEPRRQESAAPNHPGFRGAEPCIEGHSSVDRCRRPSGTWVNSPVSKQIISFDSQKTKIIEKSGRELDVKLENTVISVNK